MIPERLRKQLEAHEDIFFREDEALALLALKNLGISTDSEFAKVLIPYVLAEIFSKVSNVTIVDLSGPCEAVLRSTNFIHRRWNLPENLVCFTSLEGEGGYIMDKISEKIWDFDLAEREMFLKGEIPHQWNGFFEFTEWYISPARRKS
ncbi:SMI1/KNR4 family protein [Pseudomonas xanthosomatis]|uniref:SMI1/KNR4 family protein n=1 Tax=Pseudomonas xanthosomatis TaxID=2842356 RepID=UPI003518B021